MVHLHLISKYFRQTHGVVRPMHAKKREQGIEERKLEEQEEH